MQFASARLGLMVLIAIFPIGQSLSSPLNEADVEIYSTVEQLAITVSNISPPKQGGCEPSYTWMPEYGGCTRVDTQYGTETVACPPGYSGTQTRSKWQQKYTVQHNGAVSYGPWNFSPWNTSACKLLPVEPVSETRHTAGDYVRFIDSNDGFGGAWRGFWFYWDGQLIGIAHHLGPGIQSLDLNGYRYTPTGVIFDGNGYIRMSYTPPGCEPNSGCQALPLPGCEIFADSKACNYAITRVRL